MSIRYNTREKENFMVVEFELEGGIIAPQELAQAIELAPAVPAGKGVIISGRGPVWLFATLVHHYHIAAFVATYDPRQNGAVVVESHTKSVAVGDIIPIN